jgi:twinfilin-like protein
MSSSIICKEIGEITDARSWAERDAAIISHDDNSRQGDGTECCTNTAHTEIAAKDLGYRKNKCRLCDRRMKNRITPSALAALKQLQPPGAAVQLVCQPISPAIINIRTDLPQSVDTTTESLELNYTKNDLSPKNVAATLPPNTPSFTFYRHPTTHILYFIFHSPDHATVQQRMMHTLAIPGLINVHAKDADVHVDEKIEIHDPKELVFAARDERVGRFRSLYLRNKVVGTESVYEGLRGDEVFYDGVG